MCVNKKALLVNFIGDAEINENEIIQVSYNLFEYKGRYYTVENRRDALYGDPWYSQHQYKDYNEYRCSIKYYTAHSYGRNGKGSRSIYAGGELIYTWSNRTDYYRNRKTTGQIRQMVNSYVNALLKDFEKSGKKIDFDIPTVQKLLAYEFSRDYGRRLFDIKF